MQRRDDDQITKAQYEDRRLKAPQPQVQNQVQPQPQKCPRCDSLNTKFCYYNNYSLSQPRYLCKACRRYWTQGGTLRNVPVGGGCRKGKRAPKQSSQSSDNVKSQPPPPQIAPSGLTTPQHVILSGTPVIAPSSFFNPIGELGSSSSWVNSFGSSQGQFQIQPPEIIYEMMDQSFGKAAVSSSSPAEWSGSYINNSISNPMDSAGNTVVWTADDSNAATTTAAAANPTNNNTQIDKWPDFMPGFCPRP